MTQQNGRIIESRNQFDDEGYRTQTKSFELVLTITTFAICGYWIGSALIHRDLIDVNSVVIESVPSTAFLATVNVVIFLVTVTIVWLGLVSLRKHYTWLVTVPLIILTCTLVFITVLPTKARILFPQKAPVLDTITKQVENVHGAGRKIFVDLGNETEGQWARYYDHDQLLSVLCIKLDVGNHVSLVHSSTGVLADCSGATKWHWPFLGNWAWARRLDSHWFETSDSLLLWFLQPRQAISYIMDPHSWR